MEPPKYRQLADLLRKRIAATPGGTKLPSLRAMRKYYGVSLQTVNAALNSLYPEGKIARRQGSGIYVAQKKYLRHIAFYRFAFPSINTDIRHRSLMRACDEKAWSISTHFQDVGHNNFIPDQANLPDGVVVMPDVFDVDPEMFQGFRRRGIPLVMMGRNASSSGIDYVAGDDDMGMNQIVKTLARLNHRRIAFLVSEPHSHEIDERIKSFHRILSLLGLEPGEILDCQTVPGLSGVESTERILGEYLRIHRGKLPFTALVSASASGSIPALRILHDRGLHVPEDCSLFCMCDDPQARHLIPAITNLRWKLEDWGNYCVQVLARRFEAPEKKGCFSFEIEPGINWRETVGPPRRENTKRKS